jgi:AraC-like DNA-binding protein
MGHSSNPGFRVLFSLVSLMSWVVYNIQSFNLVRKHRAFLRNELSTIERTISLGWIFFVVVYYISFCITAVGLGIYVVVTHSVTYLLDIYIYSTLLLLVYIFGYYGLMQDDIYSRLRNVETDSRYKKSKLSVKFKKELKEKIIEFFQEDKPYLNSEFNMDMLAKQLGTPKYQITEVLNTEIGKNFFQFVNEYRVEAVKKILSREKLTYSIEAVGYDCGFNSKSSFFTVFKSLTGKTPWQFRLEAVSDK